MSTIRQVKSWQHSRFFYGPNLGRSIALTHHTGAPAIARKFEPVAPGKCTGAPVTLSRANTRKSDANKRFGSDAK